MSRLSNESLKEAIDCGPSAYEFGSVSDCLNLYVNRVSRAGLGIRRAESSSARQSPARLARVVALANGTIPQVVKDTVKHRFENLEKRVQHLEATIPDLKSLRMANIERVAEQLDYKVHFLNRRIDDLAPVDWKEKLQNSGKSLSPIQATN
uniref:Uncharacterized protein n=1 Tax=Timema tahoe TaxID=61484 RepID=A0A7R9FK87_9NEOP|nr:unnamed protein product [Timema tahoe]